MLQRTLSILKPDITARNLTGKVNSDIEAVGFRIIAQKRIILDKASAEEFYAEHKGKPFYESLVEYITSAPVIVQVLEGEDVISQYRTLMGATNPEQAAEGTLRKRYSKSMTENSVHGSDSVDSATREIDLLFNKSEIVG